MEWLLERLYALRGTGWFLSGTMGPYPGSWQGWGIFGLFLAAIAATVTLDGRDVAWPVRMAIVVLYFALAYWTVDPDDPS